MTSSANPFRLQTELFVHHIRYSGYHPSRNLALLKIPGSQKAAIL